MSRLSLSRLRPFAAAIALATAAGLAVAVPAHAGPGDAAKQRQVRGKVLAPSTLGATIDWAYDVNDEGIGYAVWVDGDSDRRRVLVAKRTAKGGWGKPQRLSGLFSRKGKREYAGEPDVAVDAKGRATVVWAEPMGPGVRLRVVSSKGKGWTKPQNLSAKSDFAGFPDVEVSDSGYAVVHWAGDFPFPAPYPFSLWAAYRDKGGSWSQPERLDTSPDFVLDARPGSIAIDDQGLTTLAWDELGSTDRIQLASRGPATGWVQQTLATGSNLNAPEVSTTPDGRLVAAWRDVDGIWAQRRSSTGAWEPPQEAVAGPGATAHNLYGAGISGTGRVALLGHEVEPAGNKIQPYVLVQDGPGAPWIREDVTGRYPQYGIDAFLPEIAVGRRGEVAVSWNEQAKNPSGWFKTFVRTRTRTGTWKPVVQLGRRSDSPALGVDGKGRFSAVFGDGDTLPACCVVLRTATLP